MKYVTAKFGFIVLIMSIGIAAAYFVRYPKPKGKCKFDDSYFPAGILGRHETNREFIIKLYSAMMEVPLICQGDEIEVYRFLFVPAFYSPISIRISQEKDQKLLILFLSFEHVKRSIYYCYFTSIHR